MRKVIVSSQPIIWHAVSSTKSMRTGVNASPSEISTEPDQHDSKTDLEEWTVINSPEDEPATGESIMSSHFDLQLGWGKWKFNVFSWDLNIKKC
ncbi:hypothetical protein P153DRAFT_366753 [Dothidotthia symphoricarpi CBS 119687]|uniref:Uncharacterized protein n=1 Tax=Dothidotthia symphoricarpi CBS 119687 TaxID=1392245 RepID=A0A6A6ACR5_9PLEO|nr:uncharacterized protein P153DRAFT_366753 [Dothidotthia symphoricarpi CBS 119687]KAF2129356.1 hypothetical protein P153DRAFT_366753 [Dothidotthia symphoricarpi CBS 119687]